MKTETIPEGWEKVILKDTVSSKQNFIDGDWIESEFITDVGIRIIQTGNIGIGRYLDREKHKKYISQKSFDFLKCKKVLPEDLLLCRLADPIGRTCVVPKTEEFYVTSVDVVIYRPDERKFDKLYLLEYLNSDSALKKAGELAAGSTRQRASRTNLEQLDIILPKDKKEQTKIANILQTIDKSIDKTEKLVHKNSLIKDGVVKELLDSVLNCVPFNDLISKILDFRGKTPHKLGMDWGDGEILALSANNVKDKCIDTNAEAYYGSDKLYSKWMNKGDCEKGDILFTMEAPLGIVTQIPDSKKYILSQRVVLFKLKKERFLNDYFTHFLRSNYFQMQLLKYSSGTTAKGIQQAQLVKLDVKVPIDKAEQTRIAKIISEIDNKIQSEQSYLDKLIKIKSGLMQDLLTGKVRVRV